MKLAASPAAVPLDAVISTHTLPFREARAADLAAENQAMLALIQTLNTHPDDILQRLTDVALELCHAGSAGVSILEDESEVFRWHGVAGGLAEHRWGTLPRYFSPCGTVVDRSAFQVMSAPERHFEYLKDVRPTVEEVLLVPFSVDQKIVGTVWVVKHDPNAHFDSEDARIVSSLAAVAAAGYQAQKTRQALEGAIKSRDEFLAILGHELRNPLSPLMTVQRLLSGDTLDDKTRGVAVEVLGRQLTHMRRLVDDILDVSRIEEGKLTLTTTVVDIGILIGDVIDAA